ncbi:glycosyltransferase [Paracoccus fontiphilus]|uniref:Glycosyltransferase n=1 Tax=Paracoccus fontiphilus TaxID=1815556 RepID=A0ABV7IEJ6_9RHOB|nr:glycosyltransferase [Paracoccus fontiphilus]
MAEGAVLEPDVHYGAAYLNALSRALHHASAAQRRTDAKIVIVGHDAHMNGAQVLALNIGRTLRNRFGVKVSFILGDTGFLLDRYHAVGDVHIVRGGEARSIIGRLAKNGHTLAITNTTPAGRFVPALKAAGFTVVSLVHELPNLLKSCGLDGPAGHISDEADHVIFPAERVRQGFESFAGEVRNSAEIFPQGLFNADVLEIARGDHGVRAELGLESNTRIVLGIGYADLRKGIDRFIATALSICSKHDDVAFVWIGSPASETTHWFQPEIEASGLGNRIQILTPRKLARYYAAANAFYLASREDPFPSVVLEALASGLPIIGHEGTGGCDDLIRRHGVLVPQTDPMAVTDAILDVISGQDPNAVEARRQEIARNYDFPDYVFGLIRRLAPHTATVSAVVPNYRYEAYVGERLRSVFDQDYPLREVIVLDDASPDNSVAEIERTAEAAGRIIDLHVNETNSGSPFPQWRKGVELAQGGAVMA